MAFSDIASPYKARKRAERAQLRFGFVTYAAHNVDASPEFPIIMKFCSWSYSRGLQHIHHFITRSSKIGLVHIVSYKGVNQIVFLALVQNPPGSLAMGGDPWLGDRSCGHQSGPGSL